MAKEKYFRKVLLWIGDVAGIFVCLLCVSALSFSTSKYFSFII
jgi:hypothetical protein